MDISKLLTDARNPNHFLRKESEAKFESLAKQNLGDFLCLLSEELSSEDKIKENRQLAASIIKNLIVMHEGMQKEWLLLDETKRSQIKLHILSTLASSQREVRRAAGSTIAGICKIELPLGKWSEIISTLSQNAFNENMNFRLASLETLGYICEELSSKSINQNDVELIISALIKNLQHESCDSQIAIICLTALLHSVSLAEKNFKTPEHSAVILETIFKLCNTFMNDEKASSIFALIIQFFIDLSQKYYQFIDPYILKISELTIFIVNF